MPYFRLEMLENWCPLGGVTPSRLSACVTGYGPELSDTDSLREVKMAQGFTTADYVVFALMLLVSAGIGVWYGCGPGAKQTSTEEYLLAGRSMRVLPVAISMLVSFLSAITLLGVPAEVYTYGAQYYVLILSYFLVCGTAGIVFAPMFRRLRVTSANEVQNYWAARFSQSDNVNGPSETVALISFTLSDPQYLERRFSVGVRLCGCLMYILLMVGAVQCWRNTNSFRGAWKATIGCKTRDTLCKILEFSWWTSHHS